MAYYLLSTGWYLKITLTYVLTNNKYHIETVLSDKFKPLKKSFFFSLLHNNCSSGYAFSLRLALFFRHGNSFCHFFSSRSRLFFIFPKISILFPSFFSFFYHISTRESTARYETRKQKYIRLS